MDVLALRTLQEICRTGSISAAAQVLGYSQSALSRQIAGLEARLGVPLLERHARGVRPTPAGSVLLDHAAVILQRVERAERDVAASHTHAVSRLQVGAVPSVAAGLLPRALTAFGGDSPNVRVGFVEGMTPGLLPRLRDGELDVAVVTDYPPGLPADAGLAMTHLLDEPSVCILPPTHRLAARDAVDLAELAEDTWVEDYAGAASMLAAACARAGFTPRIDIECGSWLGKQAFVAEGHGVALAPRLLVPSLRPDLAVRPLTDPPTRSIYAARRTATPGRGQAQAQRPPQAQGQAADAFIRALVRAGRPDTD
ncbi:LysR family transcriptional regulator [Yinghuangia soli]|uniref:LysR family transcriptional regulator n=1 Tax=Yinghuangia soli TaxID=2908204 RepID=A0AA41U2N0_9ACTN|nr:LysR family transcriptional regulator [Yinghuangia soli]MCF2530866.1 LysR family transcriptional regulator [Yinghuangia soli]